MSALAFLLFLPGIYFACEQPSDFRGWLWLVASVILIQTIRWRIESRATYGDVISPQLQKYGLQLIESRPLKRGDTGPFPKIHRSSRPSFHSRTPMGSGEFVKYRRLSVRDAQGVVHAIHVLLEFRAFRCSQIVFEPALSSTEANLKAKR